MTRSECRDGVKYHNWARVQERGQAVPLGPARAAGAAVLAEQEHSEPCTFGTSPAIAKVGSCWRWHHLRAGCTFFKDPLGPLLLLGAVRSREGGMLIPSDLPLLHVGCVGGGTWPSSSLVCVLRTWSGPRQQWRERKLCLPVSFLSAKALAWKPDHPPCCLSVLHLALRAPVACRIAKKRNSPWKTRKRFQVHSPKHHAVGQVWGKLFTFLRRKEILRNKLVTSPKMARFCCSFF